MKFKRNGNGVSSRKKPKAKLVRNGNGNGKKKTDTTSPLDGKLQKLFYKGAIRHLTKAQLKSLEMEDKRIIKWIEGISKHERFSREWILTCLTELSLQCMGKVPHAVGDMYTNTFLPKAAISGLKLMAEIQGFNVYKVDARLGILTPYEGAIAQQNKMIEPDDGPKQITLEENDAITAEVTEILHESGAFQSQTEKVVDAKMVEVHPTPATS